MSLISCPCRICGQTTSHWCSRCQKVWYCSDEHLQQDWPNHRKECTPAPQSLTPSANHPFVQFEERGAEIVVAGLLLNPHEERARIISVVCRPRGRNQCPLPDVQTYFPDSVPSQLVLTQGLNQEPLRFPLQLFYCAVSLSRGTPINKSVRRITSGKTKKNWSGPVVVLKYAGSRRLNYGDASTHDLATLSAYFLSLK